MKNVGQNILEEMVYKFRKVYYWNCEMQLCDVFLPCIVQILVLAEDHPQRLPDSAFEFSLFCFYLLELSLDPLESTEAHEFSGTALIMCFSW